jgi:hypothetical protein
MTVGMRLSDQNVLLANHTQTVLQYVTHVLLPLYLPFAMMYLEFHLLCKILSLLKIVLKSAP